MHQLRTPLAVGLCALAAIVYPAASADGIPIHRHYTVHRVVTQGPGAPPIPATFERVRVVDVAPKDTDQDGVADRRDPCPQTAGSDGGCPPPPPTVVATSALPTAVPAGGGSYSNVPGVPASFAACVATRESSNGAGSSNIYGIIPASGSDAGSGTLAEQQAAFSQLYAQYGTAPWAPYDGC